MVESREVEEYTFVVKEIINTSIRDGIYSSPPIVSLVLIEEDAEDL